MKSMLNKKLWLETDTYGDDEKFVSQLLNK